MDADTVTALDVGLYPERDAPEPTLLQSRERAILVFAATARDERAVTAVAEFTGCLATRFGYPDDEALPGHPLYRNGLRCYLVSEVLHSSWLRQVYQQHLSVFPHDPAWEQRHFVITLHRSTFECLAENINITVTNDPHHIALLRILQEPL
jgi:hypothetical protein